MDEQITCRDFLLALESKAPTPGGGGASALAGAAASALGHMVGALTVGKKAYAAVEADMNRLMAQAHGLTEKMLTLVDQDAAAFRPLAAAYKMPQGTPEEKAEKEAVMERCLADAGQVPLQIMEACGEIIELLEEFAAKGSRMVISDAATAAAICSGALRGASINVFVNTRSMKERARAEAMEKRAEELLQRYLSLADDIFEGVKEKL
ncbi:MAG: cyclodeaminase/cyclohydrolase family protein [Eubacteriales bacterium]|jgi:formiminotetrahydrofolate cyclodeaminase|nr:cyclodeaminase/cyclohydrolase family protein [Eubacteriales bacterium]